MLSPRLTKRIPSQRPLRTSPAEPEHCSTSLEDVNGRGFLPGSSHNQPPPTWVEDSSRHGGYLFLRLG